MCADLQLRNYSLTETEV